MHRGVSANMFANPPEPYSISAAELVKAASSRDADRRKRVRTRLHLRLALYSDSAGAAVHTETEDLSSSGFYFLSRKPFICGELLIGRLSIPTYDPSGREPVLALECRVRVVRAEAVGDEGFFGVGCQIEDYHLSRETSSPG